MAGKTRIVLGGVRDGPALDEAERAAVAEEDVAEGEVAAAAGPAVEDGSDGVAGEGEDAAGARGGHEAEVEVVGEVDLQDAVAVLEELRARRG